jgi:ParB/RepB/Spo0J family partition protein
MSAAAESLKAPPQSRTGPAFLEDLPISSIVLAKNVRELRPEDVEDLARDIVEQGVLNPVDVSMGAPGTPGDLKYTLVAGHRRVAAAKLAKLRTIPARVFELTPDEVVEFQISENIHRKNLSELEEARAFKDYVDAGHTQVELAKRIGKSPPYVANRIRLLGLPEPVRKNLESGKLSASHAEILASAPKEIVGHLQSSAITQDWSVSRLATETKWKADRFHEAQVVREAFSKKVAASKFPTCQALVLRSISGKGPGETPFCCGRKAVREDYRGGEWVTCGLMGHAWSLKTGHVPPKEREAVREEPKREERVEPKLPQVSPEAAFYATPATVADHFMRGSSKVTAALVNLNGKRNELLLRVEIGKAVPKELRSFVVGNFGDHLEVEHSRAGSAWMFGCDSWDQQTDASRKKLAESKQFLEDWARKLGGKKGKK